MQGTKNIYTYIHFIDAYWTSIKKHAHDKHCHHLFEIAQDNVYLYYKRNRPGNLHKISKVAHARFIFQIQVFSDIAKGFKNRGMSGLAQPYHTPAKKVCSLLIPCIQNNWCDYMLTQKRIVHTWIYYLIWYGSSLMRSYSGQNEKPEDLKTFKTVGTPSVLNVRVMCAGSNKKPFDTSCW